MALGDAILGGLAVGKNERAIKYEEVADQMAARGYDGPACPFYAEAYDLFNAYDVQSFRRDVVGPKLSQCKQNAIRKGENVDLAFEPPFSDICEYPRIFVAWYLACHQNQYSPWKECLQHQLDHQQEIEDAGRQRQLQEKAAAKAATRAAAAEVDKREREKILVDYRSKSKVLFNQRWQLLVDAAARAAGGDHAAQTEAVALWRRAGKPSAEVWKKGWSAHARTELQRMLQAPASDAERRALPALIGIARRAECGALRLYLMYLAAILLGYPTFYALGALSVGIPPQDASPGLLPGLLYGGGHMLTTVFGIVQGLLKFLTIPALLIWLFTFLVTVLPEHLRMRNALMIDDVHALPVGKLFSVGGGRNLT